MDTPSLLRKIFLIAIVPTSLAVSGCAVTTTRSGYGYEDTVWIAPPPARAEVVTVAPHPGYFWINGYWGWRDNDYRWVPGYWEAPRNGYRWEPHRWERQGSQWRDRPGHWERTQERHDSRRPPSDHWGRR